jgi:cell division protein FtsN
MARSRRKSSGSRSGGSTLFGVLIGLIVGLGAAVAVALFVTKAPMPFADKFSRSPAQTLLPELRDAPDPNIGLYGKNAPAGGPTDTAPLGAPGTGVRPQEDNIGDLIASLSRSAPASEAPTTATPGSVPLPPPAPATRPGETNSGATTPAVPAPGQAAQATYYLQAGAFRSQTDAEAVKARILLLGLPAQVQKAQVNGGVINRVRVGPFNGIDEMNRSRARLGEEKIESSVVRQ